MVEAKGHLEAARRTRSLAGRMFRYAVATSRATADPSGLLRGALTAPTVDDTFEHARLIRVGRRSGFREKSPRQIAYLIAFRHLLLLARLLFHFRWIGYDAATVVDVSHGAPCPSR